MYRNYARVYSAAIIDICMHKIHIICECVVYIRIMFFMKPIRGLWLWTTLGVWHNWKILHINQFWNWLIKKKHNADGVI